MPVAPQQLARDFMKTHYTPFWSRPAARNAAICTAFLSLTSLAHAQGPSAVLKPIEPTLEAQQTRIAPGMSAVDVLAAQSAIENNWANYSLLLDGDGTSLRTEQWPGLSFTNDFTWDFYDANGKLTSSIDMAETREIGLKESAHEGVVHRPWKHLPIITKFDEVTPTTAKTRTVVVFLVVPKANVPNRADGVEGLSTPAVPQAGMAVYHDSWRKEDGIWKKSSSALFATNCGWFPSGPPAKEYSCIDEKAMSTD
jgi:hypothetical protein